MPVKPVIGTHVVADQNDLAAAELNCKVESLKSTVAAFSDAPWMAGYDLILILDLFDALEAVVSSRPAIQGDLEAFKLRLALSVSPPSTVAGVKNVTPGRQHP